MSLDRAEVAGTGAAIVFHVALIAALSLSLAHVARPSEPPPMEVEMVDEVGLQPAAPTVIAAPPPPSQAPEQAQDAPQPPSPEPTPAPVIQPTPQSKVAPTNSLAAQIAQLRPTPSRPPVRPKPSRIGANFLQGIADAAPTSAPAKPAASVFSAQAQINVGQALLLQAKRCALRETFLGDGANRVRLRVNLVFARDGRLLRSPTVLSRSGDPDLVAKYGDLLEDQVRRIFADCAPFRLPPELYDTGNGGWKNFTFSYRVD